jgi:hypothetical protein
MVKCHYIRCGNKINGGKTELSYLHKSMLTEELSVDLKWSTLTINSTIVAADIV